MFSTVEFPLWFVILAGALAIVGLLDRLLMPSVRWYLRRRLNRAIERLNDRLQLRIQPFKLTRRKTMINRLVHDPKVAEAIDAHARQEDIPYDVAADMALTYAREIVPSFSAFTYFGFAIRLSRLISQALYRVRIGFMDDKALREVDPDATVVFVMNHRSNMDYVLVTYLASERSALSYAVGEWARVWPLQQLIRSLGAYFIRRKSRNILYRRVLARYVQMATEGGVTQAVFPEGGLSLDGKPKPVKLGLLSYMLEGFEPGQQRDVVFVPVGLNYDRVLEDRVLTTVDPDGQRTFAFKLPVFLGFIRRQLWLRMTKRFYRYGYACVSFGRPISLQTFLEQRKPGESGDQIADFGQLLKRRVENVIPVLPVPLVATAMIDADQPTTRLDLKARCHSLLQHFEEQGAHIHLPRSDADYAVEVGLRILKLRKIVTEQDGCLQINAPDRDLLAFYANSVAHLLPVSGGGDAT